MKKIIVIGIIAIFAMVIMCGCIEEDEEEMISLALLKGEETQIPGTDYFL